MLSISKPFKGAGRADYYINLAQEDYYTEGLEPPGFWLGSAKEHFGLSGDVHPEDFRQLLQGFHPRTGKPLVHNAGSAKRRSGWDLTWSPPKSVSVAWSQATPEVRAQIENAMRESVWRAIAYLETVGIVSRRGTDGVIQEKAKLVFAAYEHSTSRALDPQLHIHTVLIHVGLRPDGTTGGLEPRAFYRHQMAAGALFRAELAARLELELGLRARREGRAFELLGVDLELMAAFSKRRAQIEARMRELGVTSAEAAEKVALDTRETKEHRSRDDLFPEWRKIGLAHHWSTKELSWILNAPFLARDFPQEIAKARGMALETLTTEDSHFNSRKLTQALAEEAQGRGLNADAVLMIHSDILRSADVVPLICDGSDAQWTTPAVLELEKRALDIADGMSLNSTTRTPLRIITSRVGAEIATLSVEQRRALEHVTQTDSRLTMVSGMAGTGKSTLFRVANQIWVEQGRQVAGACLSGKAALELHQASQIPTQTIHRLLRELDSGRMRLSASSLLLIDEAAMVGTRQLHALLQHCNRARASMVLCGDDRQLQSIEAGGLFGELARRHGTETLREIRRQREPWARQAVMAFAEGRAAEALGEYAGRGLVALHDSPREAMSRLIQEWRREGDLGAVILAGRNADVLELNTMAQGEQQRGGMLKGEAIELGGSRIYRGDRILFARNSRELGVFNGQTATVAFVSRRELVAQLTGGSEVRVRPDIYPNVRLGYALTTHKAQGLTAERVFVYVDPTVQSRETVYVQASRARGLCSFYAVGSNLEELIPSMERSRPKVLATSLLLAQESPMLSLQMLY